MRTEKRCFFFSNLLNKLFFCMCNIIWWLNCNQAKNKRELLKDKCLQENYIVVDTDVEESDNLTKFIDECRLALLTFKRNELSIELVTQLTIHVTMILLSKTDHPIESGLQSIFNNDKDKIIRRTGWIRCLNWRLTLLGPQMIWKPRGCINFEYCCAMCSAQLKNQIKTANQNKTNILFVKCGSLKK